MFQLPVALGNLPGLACKRSREDGPGRKTVLDQGRDEWVGEAGVLVSDRAGGATSRKQLSPKVAEARLHKQVGLDPFP